MTRLRGRLELEEVPYTDADLDLLSKLRRVRNSVSHGESPEVADSTTIDQGVAIVARMLVWRVVGAIPD